MFPERIRERRKKMGMTQDELAEAVGVKRAVISKYENGLIEPSFAMLEKIAEALRVPTAHLTEGGDASREELIRAIGVEYLRDGRPVEEATNAELIQEAQAIWSKLLATVKETSESLQEYQQGYSELKKAGLLESEHVKELQEVAAAANDLNKQLEGIDFALYGEIQDLTEAQKCDILRFAQFLKQKDTPND